MCTTKDSTWQSIRMSRVDMKNSDSSDWHFTSQNTIRGTSSLQGDLLGTRDVIHLISTLTTGYQTWKFIPVRLYTNRNRINGAITCSQNQKAYIELMTNTRQENNYACINARVHADIIGLEILLCGMQWNKSEKIFGVLKRKKSSDLCVRFLVLIVELNCLLLVLKTMRNKIR